MEIDLESAAPGRRAGPGFRRWLSVLVAVTAITAATLGLIEFDMDAKREHALVQSSRGAVEIFARIAASSQQREFAVGAERRALETSLKADTRLDETRGNGEAAAGVATAQSSAEHRAARRLLAVASPMFELSEDGPLDPATLEAVETNFADLQHLVAEQEHSVEDAHHYAVIQGRTTFGLSLVAIAASLLALAGLLGAGRAARVVMITAGTALVLAIGVSASGYLA